MSFTDQDTYSFYTGNGSTDEFAITFEIQANSQVDVYLYDTTTKEETLQTAGVHYAFENTVTPLVPDPANQIDFVTAPAVGKQVRIYRNTDITQETELENNGTPQTGRIEAALDKLTMLVQEVFRRANLALVRDILDSDLNMSIPLKSGKAGMFLILNEDEDGFEWSEIVAGELQTAIDAAQAAAEAAQAAAENAQTAAELAETNAETAETNAETAETNAEAAQAAAEAAAATAVGAADAAVAAITYGAFGSVPNDNGGSFNGATKVHTLQPADATHPGGIALGTQTIPGAKTLAEDLTLAKGMLVAVETDSTTTGADQVPSMPLFIKRFTNGTLASLTGIVAPAAARLIILTNATGAVLTIKNDTGGTAANRIITGTGANLTWKNAVSLWLAYDTAASRWRIVGGAGGGENVVTVVSNVGAGATLAISTTEQEQTFVVEGNGAAVTLSTTPFGSSPPPNGAKIWVIGSHDTNTVDVPVNDASNGCLQNGAATAYRGVALCYMYLSTLSRYVRIV